MRRRRAAGRAALPLVVLLLALHVRPAGAGDNILQRLWAKAATTAPADVAGGAPGNPA